MRHPKYFVALALMLSLTAAKAESWKLSLPVSGETSQAISPDGKQIAVAPTFGPVVSFSTELGQVLALRARPTERSYSFAWQQDGKGFYYGDPDGKQERSVVAFDGKHASKQLPGGDHQLAASPDGRWLATLDYAELKLLDLRTGHLKTRMTTGASEQRLSLRDIEIFAWDQNGILFLVQKNGGYASYAVQRLDPTHSTVLPAIELPESRAISALALDETHHHLWLGTTEGRLLDIDLSSGKVLSDRSIAQGEIGALALSKEGHLAAWVNDGILLAEPELPAQAPVVIPAWRTEKGGPGERPVLAWMQDDLLMAGRSESQWLAERRKNVWAASGLKTAADVKEFTRLSALAAQGDAAAQLGLGEMYLSGRGVKEDKAQAIAWWQKSADGGNPQAQINLGFAYSRKGGGVVTPDPAKSRYWWKKAADRYHDMAEQGDRNAAGALGEMYAKGMGVHKDPLLADLLLRIANGKKYGKWLGSDSTHRLENQMRVEQRARVDTVLAQWKPGTSLPRDMRAVICGPSRYAQPKFDAKAAQTEFRDFQARLRADMDALADSDGLATQEGDAALIQLRKLFADSIAAGPKGDYLLTTIAAPASGRIVPPMWMMLDALQNMACPVGYGGTFTDDGRQVELWYVELSPFDEEPMKAFAQPELPPFGSLQRNVFPALVFVRDANNRLQWFGVSQEMATILRYWFNVQIG